MAVLLQIRVENQVAENIKEAARLRGKTPNAYLKQLVKRAAHSERRGLKNRDKSGQGAYLNLLRYDLVAKLRDDDGD